jgi:nitroimidazol reductase NimA-like FMN-containing flavoprotein (pyridoxamine 5'-phosphate oxidase superfamily)
VLLRLAKALETTASSLSGGEADRPPGPGRAGPHPHLDVLSRTGCEAHPAGGGVGRFVFLSAQRPVALPVNFRLVDGDVVFRSRATGSLAAAVGATVSFEVDQIDEAMSEGWSVLIPGRARIVDDPAERLAVTVAGPAAVAGVDAERLRPDPSRARLCALAHPKGCQQ